MVDGYTEGSRLMQMSNLLWCMAQAELTGENDRWCSREQIEYTRQGQKGKRDGRRGITQVEERERERGLKLMTEKEEEGRERRTGEGLF